MITAMYGIYHNSSDLDPASMGKKGVSSGQQDVVQTPEDLQALRLPCAHVLFENLRQIPSAL